MSKKTFFLSMFIVVPTTLQLLNILNINSKSQDKNLHHSKVRADITKTSQTRHVAKFKSTKRSSTSKNWFQNMKNQNLATNSSVFLSNKASFKYQVGYSNYNAYGAKNSNFHVTVAKNTTHQAINIGANSISAITVKVSAPGQKWANLTITSNFTPTKDMIPTSIHYLILGAKNINDANVSLNISYEERTDPMTPITVKIGHFNVNNINANVGTVLSSGAIAGIVVGCVITAMLVAIVGGIYFLWKRVVKKATTEMRTIISLADDEAALQTIRSGRSLYGEGSKLRRLTDDFEAKTDIIIKRADHTKLFTGASKVTKEESIGRMITARNKVEAARLKGVVARNDRILVFSDIPKFEAPRLETNPVIGLKDKGLDGHTGPAWPTIDPIFPSGDSGATNIPKEFGEATTPVNPIKQVSVSQDSKLAEQETNGWQALRDKLKQQRKSQEELQQELAEESATEAELTERTTEEKDQSSVKEIAGTGEYETSLSNEDQEDSDLDEDLSGVRLGGATESTTEVAEPGINITEEQAENETVLTNEEQEDNDLGEGLGDVQLDGASESTTEVVELGTNITEEQAENETVLTNEEQDGNDLGEGLGDVQLDGASESTTEVVELGTNITEEQAENETVLTNEEQEDNDLGEGLGDVQLDGASQSTTEVAEHGTNITEEQAENETILTNEEQEDNDLGEGLGDVKLDGVIKQANLTPALPENTIGNGKEELAVGVGDFYNKDNIRGGNPLRHLTVRPYMTEEGIRFRNLTVRPYMTEKGIQFAIEGLNTTNYYKQVKFWQF